MKRWLSFWREHARAMGLAVILFIFGVIIGFLFWQPLSHVMQDILSQLVENVGVDPSGEVNSLSLFFGLFMNNSIAVIILILSGFFFGIYPAWGMILNGLLLGYLLAATTYSGGDPFAMFIFGILPHGIFEIPALILAATYGLILGAAVFKWVIRLFSPRLRAEDPVQWKKMFRPLLPTLGITLLLLLIAAAIESTITVYLVKTFVAGV
ncbi:MAG: stage II sporulation protein M [Thermicanus sp.]|nr:stage II sporulation protein M [Thermicanus sp.]